MDTNLIEPLTFAEGEIDKFIQRNVCAFCGGHLNKFFAPGRRYFARCLNEPGYVTEGSTMRIGTARKLESNTLAAMRELR